MKKRILHIHSDYPDGRKNYSFTKAVSNLIDATPGFEHYVVSINRTSNIFKTSYRDFDQGISIVFWCLPIPGVYRFTLWLFCKYLSYRLKDLNMDVIHGHKLTIDGVVASYLAKKYHKPYCLSVRGGTDLGYIKRFPGLKSYFSKVLSGADCVFWLAPWTQREVCKALATTPKSSVNLPNFCQIPTSKASNCPQTNKVFTVASYSQYKRKAVLEVIESIACLQKQGIRLSLDIYGGGDEQVKTLIYDKIVQLDLQESVFIKGQIEHKVLIEKMSEYSALVLPSVNETFGMVFVESLAANVPFIAHKNFGVDGYFDGDYAVFIDSQQPKDIAYGIATILKNQKDILASLQSFLASGEFYQFTKDGVADTYSSRVFGILGNSN